MQPLIRIIKDFLDHSLKEDWGIRGDITSEILISQGKKGKFQIIAKEDLTLCGGLIAAYYLENYSSVEFNLNYQDGASIKQGDIIITGSGNVQEILLLERIMLNFMQFLSGIATLTNKYVQETNGTKAKICDTRKTLPMWRHLQKYAVRCGGGHNHRLTLDSAIMIKDNHIACCGSIENAIKLAKLHQPHYTRIEVECDDLEQVQIAADHKADIIMLDNMDIPMIEKAIKIIDQKSIIEVSGNITLDRVKDIAKLGVDVISVGRITHSAPSVNISLDIL